MTSKENTEKDAGIVRDILQRLELETEERKGRVKIAIMCFERYVR